MKVLYIFRNKKFIEVLTADILGHRYNTDPYGPDAFEMIGGMETPTEYKSANRGGSFQFHWLSKNKMNELKKYQNVYFIIKSGVSIDEIYSIPMFNIIKQIEEKASGSDSINGHKSFSIKKLIGLGAKKIK